MKVFRVLPATVAGFCMAAVPALAQTIENFEPVTDEILTNPSPDIWPAYGRALNNYRYSPLDQINKDNVHQLQLVWARGMEPGARNQVAPLYYNGVLYTANPRDVIQAINAKDGTLIWEHRRDLSGPFINPFGERKRGIALYGDKVIYVSWDNHVIALDARTGQVVWDNDRGQGDAGVTNSTGPLAANGMVFAGSTCQVSPFTCYVTAHDADTGEEVWRNYPISREEGDETWAGSGFESRWMTGVWGLLTYDPEVNILYYGSSATGPASETQRGTPGGSQYGTNTRFAVVPETGKVLWRHQVLPRDNWDQDCTFEMINMVLNVNPNPDMEGLRAVGPNARGERRVHIGVPCKTGNLWAFDALDGEFLWARDTSYQDILVGIDEQGLVSINEDRILKDVGEPVLWCPSHSGGRDWPPASFNPETKVMFLPLSNLCQESTPIDRTFTSRNVYNVDSSRHLPPGFTNVGRIDAVNLETGDTVWSYETEAPIYSPIMTTGSGLLFTGGTDRYFRVLDQDNGDLLWQVRLGSAPQGHAITYEIDGRQYVAIPAGGGGGLNGLEVVQNRAALDPLIGSHVMYVFALPEAR